MRARSLWAKALAYAQYIVPHHGISRLVHRAARIPNSGAVQWAMRWYMRHYGVDLSEAQNNDLNAFADFNAFFTRALRPEARPMPDSATALASPVDGFVSELGSVVSGRLLQAKGRLYSLTDLLGGSYERAQVFEGGAFITLYLSPADYHRVHMPVAGQLREMVHIPGRLFSVSPASVAHIPGLFARNERVVNVFDTDYGPLALVMVGAINVGSMETVWASEVTPPRGRQITAIQYAGHQADRYPRGAEMGRFNLGSTVILVLPPDRVKWSPSLHAGQKVRMGQGLGELRPAA